MPPKTQFKREDVIKAGLEVVRKHGLKELTARRIAKRLKSSTAPVYSQFESMKELELEVMKSIRDKMVEYTMRPYTDQIFLNMGLGIPRFAREHPLLYRALFLERSDFKSMCEELFGNMIERMGEDKSLVSLSPEGRAELLQSMSIFTHGLATLICVGLAPDSSDAFILRAQLAVGEPVIQAAKNKYEQSLNKNQNRGDN